MRRLSGELKELSIKFQEKECNDRARLQGLGNDLNENIEKTVNLLDSTKVLKDDLEFLKDKYQEKEHDEDVQEPDEEEPGIALEDQLRITDQSAKAIDLLSSHLLSTVWQTCSRNTFGKCSLTLFSNLK